MCRIVEWTFTNTSARSHVQTVTVEQFPPQSQQKHLEVFIGTYDVVGLDPTSVDQGFETRVTFVLPQSLPSGDVGAIWIRVHTTNGPPRETNRTDDPLVVTD